MNINSNINSLQTYNQQAVNNQAKLPTGAAAKETVNAFDKIIANAASPMKSTDVAKSLGAISEGISSVEEQLKADAQVAKMNLKALFNKLSGAEAVKLDEDGFDINDIDDEELVTIVDRIKIMLAAYNENYQVFAGAFDMPDEEAVKDAGVSSAVAGEMAAKASTKLEENYMPATEENITQVETAAMMAQDIAGNPLLSESAKAYMIDNELEPTVENVYKAQHSTAVYGNRTALSEADWQQIRPQVEKIVKNSDLEDSDQTYKNARWLVENELPVTKENLVKKQVLDDLTYQYEENQVIEQAAKALRDYGNAAKINLADSSKESVFEKAAKAIEIVNKADYDTVENLVRDHKNVTIEAMAQQLSINISVTSVSVSASMSSANMSNASMLNNSINISAQALHSYRMLCEARMLMTANATVSVLNKGLDIYSMDMENLVEMLHEEETKFINEELTKANAGSVSESDLNAVSSVQDALAGLRFAPSAAIGQVVMEAQVTTASITIQSVSATAMNTRRQYEQAGQAYETMSTKVRSDMGDSVKEAMKNSSESILNEMGYEINEVNLRAVRILAYNSMEMSESNVEQVKNVDSMINQLMDNMTPQVTYDMIKQGINPMEASVEELNQFISEQYANEDSSIKYSEFLYKLEKQENLTPEERSQYIGIYKMFHMFKKDGGKAVGALLNQNADITLKNLVMAVQSRRQYGMDVSLDVDAGLATVTGSVAYYNNLFQSLEKSITPAGLKAASKEVEEQGGNGSFENISPEHLAELMEKYKAEDQGVKEAYYEEMVTEMEQYQNIEDSVLRLLTDYEMPVTFYNLMAANQLANENRLFGDLQKRDNQDVNEVMEQFMEKLEDSDSMNEAYEELGKVVKEASEQAVANQEEPSYVDMNQWKLIGKSVNLMGALGRKQQYFIPFATEDGLGSIRLKLVSDGEEAGKMEMSFETKSLGKVYAMVSVDSDKANGYMVTDRAEAEDILIQNVDKLRYSIEAMGIKECDLKVGYSETMIESGLNTRDSKVPSAMLYRMAKSILTNLVAI